MRGHGRASGERSDLLRLTSRIVAAYVSRNEVMAADLPELIRQVHRALEGVSAEEGTGKEMQPAVPIKNSVTPDYIVCLEDGRKLKMLKRYLRSTYGLTPEAYRAKWSLPADYPMVAPNYASQRSAFAKKIGLGRRNGAGEP